MEKKYDKIRKNIDIHKIILYIIIFVLVVIIVVMYLSSHQTKGSNPTDNINIQQMVDNKETMVIFVYSSKSSRCSYCSKVEQYLDSNEITYRSYDIEKVTKENYQELLDMLDIDSDIFGYPALIYIKNGEVYANVINIDNTEVIEKFIDNYDLDLK